MHNLELDRKIVTFFISLSLNIFFKGITPSSLLNIAVIAYDNMKHNAMYLLWLGGRKSMLGHVEKEQVVCKMAIFVHLFSKYSVGLQRERFAV